MLTMQTKSHTETGIETGTGIEWQILLLFESNSAHN